MSEIESGNLKLNWPNEPARLRAGSKPMKPYDALLTIINCAQAERYSRTRATLGLKSLAALGFQGDELRKLGNYLELWNDGKPYVGGVPDLQAVHQLAQKSERAQLIAALDSCAAALEAEVTASAGEDHPTINEHAKRAAAARKLLALIKR